MAVERGPGVTYYFFEVPENAIENVDSWTDAARKIREVGGDVKKLAIALAPNGRVRKDQVRKIKTSHGQGASPRKVFKSYQIAVFNTAPHAYWVHQGTKSRGRFPVFNRGKWLGPVKLGPGIGRLQHIEPGEPEGTYFRTGTSAGMAFPKAVYFHHYLWRGQRQNPWLARAGQAAYQLPGNH
jgi:hypothetical protein